MERLSNWQDLYPCCIVWTPIPACTWCFPFIGLVPSCSQQKMTIAAGNSEEPLPKWIWNLKSSRETSNFGLNEFLLCPSWTLLKIAIHYTDYEVQLPFTWASRSSSHLFQLGTIDNVAHWVLGGFVCCKTGTQLQSAWGKQEGPARAACPEFSNTIGWVGSSNVFNFLVVWNDSHLTVS